MAERAVQVIKLGLRKNKGDFQLRLARTLFTHRKTPHATTGVTPAELMLGRQMRTHLDLLHPDLTTNVQKKQLSQCGSTTGKTKLKNLKIGDPVYARSYNTETKWQAGTIHQVLGALTFFVKLTNGVTVKRHMDQLKRRHPNPSDHDSESSSIVMPQPATPTTDSPQRPDNVHAEPDPVPRQSTREIRPPDRFEPTF